MAGVHAVAHQLAHDAVGLPEGHALLGQIVGAVGGADKAPVGGVSHVGPVDGQGVDHGGEHRQAELHGVDGVEDGLLVLLHILVVGQGDALHHSEQGDEGAVHPPGLAPDQLGHVGVLLLGHDGGAGGIGVVQLDELELPTAPENELLGEPGQVHHEDGAGGEELDGKVPVGDPVQGVVHGFGEAQELRRAEPVHRVGGGGQGPGAQGGFVQPGPAVLKPGDVPAEHIGVGHHGVGEGDGLGPLEVGVPRHDGVQIPLGLPDEGLFQLQEHPDDDGDLLLDEQPEVQGHLVVPAPGGVEPLAGGPDALGEQDLHVHVDVLAVLGELHLAVLDLVQEDLQGLHDLVGLFLGDDPLLPQHGGVGHGAGDVLLIQPGIEGDGGVEVVYLVVGFLLKPACPKLHRRISFLSINRKSRSGKAPARANGSIVKLLWLTACPAPGEPGRWWADPTG